MQMLYNRYILFLPIMKKLNSLQAGYYDLGTKLFNFSRSPYFKPLLILTVMALPFVLSSCAEGAEQIKQLATATPHVDPTATAIPDILNSAVCKITSISNLGADAQGVHFPNAIPEGGEIIMQCGAEEVHAQLHYSNEVFGTTTFVNGNGVDQMAGLGDTVREVGRNLQDCNVGALAAPAGNGGSAFHQSVDIAAGDRLIQMTTVGNSTSILASEQNTTAAGFDIVPESLAGAGGPPYETGYSSFGWFSTSAEQVIDGVKHMVLNFKGIFNPDSRNCPAFVDQLDQ